MSSAPNNALQRTRSAPLRSPLSFQTFGDIPRPVLLLSLFAALGFMSLSCDPGIHYRPRGWKKIEEYRWASSIADIDLETRGTGGLIHSRWLSPEFTVRNRSDRIVRIAGATLVTSRGTYRSRRIPSGEERWFETDPGATRRITVVFDFEQPITEILVDPVSLTLEIFVGDEMHSLPIAMRRDG